MSGYADNVKALGSRANLHAVVLDYVTHHGYVETARELAKPGSSKAAAHLAGSTDMDVDEPLSEKVGAIDSESPVITPAMLHDAEQRREIIDHVLNGAISQAIETLNAYFPELFTASRTADKHLRRPAAAQRPESAARHSNGNSNGNGHTTDYVMPVYHTSLHPDHIRVNLQIQQFIELFRRQSTPTSPSSSNGSTSDSTGSLGVTHSLASAHNLYHEVNKLDPEDQAIYMQEVKDAAAMLAYTDPETSILKGFLDQRRRIALAEQVNKAMLHHRGQMTTTRLEEYARRTTHILNVMEHYGLNAVPSWTAADGLERETLAAYIKHEDGFNLSHFASA